MTTPHAEQDTPHAAERQRGSPDYLRVLAARAEPLYERIERNRRRLRAHLTYLIGLSSLLIAVSLVAGAYLTFGFFALRSAEPVLVDALVGFTAQLPGLTLSAWAFCSLGLSFWSVVVLKRGEGPLLAILSATPVAPGELPSVKSALHDVAIATGARPPRLALIDDDALNAAAVHHASELGWIVVTRGLVERLDKDELRAVLAHLTTRIRDGSARTTTVLAELFVAATRAARLGDGLLDSWHLDGTEGVLDRITRALTSPLAVFYATTRFCLGASAAVIASVYRRYQLMSALSADAHSVLVTRDPAATVRALEKVLPADNRPGAVWQHAVPDEIVGALYFAWPTYSFSDDPELERIARLREVLGPAAL